MAERWIDTEPDSGWLYNLREIEEEYGLTIPKSFQRCGVCEAPAAWLQCSRAVNYKHAGYLPEEEGPLREFLEQIREWAGSNVELPLCEEHKHYGEIGEMPN